MTNIAEFVKERREAKGLSKRKLAMDANISHTEVHRIENGERPNPSVTTLVKLAKALGVSKEELLKTAGYIDEYGEGVAPIEKVFPDLKTEKQQKTARKIIDGLARNSDLAEEDYDKLVDQMEMFLDHAKKKKNT